MLRRAWFYSLRRPKDFLNLTFRRRPFDALAGVLVKQSFKKALGPQPAHAYAKEVRNAFPAQWESYFKFCVVRNPFEKVVSDYYWRTKSSGEAISFSEFLDSLVAQRESDVAPLRPDNWPIYTIDDKVAVDKVIRYETLSDGLAEVMQQIGLPFDGDLPTAKGGLNRSRSRDPQWYRSVYSDRDRERVTEMFAKEIVEFGYGF